MTPKGEAVNEIAGDVLKAASEALYDPHVAGPKMVTGPVLLRVAGAIQAERERAAKIAEADTDWTTFQRNRKPDHLGQETNAFAPPADDGTYPTAANVFAYTTGIATGRAIAAAIRSGESP